jgi:hypothetical protein
VFTDYGNGPGFNLSVIDVAVLSQDESGAEFAAGPKTKIGKQAHAFDRCEVNGTGLGVGRTYHRIDGSSTWIVRPVGQGRPTLTGLRPFTEEAEQGAREAGSRPAA